MFKSQQSRTINNNTPDKVDVSMATSTILLPGEPVPTDLLPRNNKKGTLTLGPGLRHIPPSTIVSTTSGTLHVDPRKSALWLESTGGRYLPVVGDLVVAQIHHSGADLYYVSLTPHTANALLGQLAFEGANKKTRPKLDAGDLVYARVSRTSKWDDTELECVHSGTGKADGMGPLKGGMVFNVSLSFARRLMMGADKEGKSRGNIVVLEEVGNKMKFEVAVGRNGRIWVNSGSVQETCLIGRLLVRADEESWSMEQQRKEIKKALKDG